MTKDVTIEGIGQVRLHDGIHPTYSAYYIPQAEALHATGEWGTLCFQEIRTKKYTFRHFLFSLTRTVQFSSKEQDEGLQSLISLKGDVQYEVEGVPAFNVNEKEFALFQAGNKKTLMQVASGSICSLLNTYYQPDAYRELLSLFPAFKKDLKKAFSRPFSFLSRPKIARYTIHDSIIAIWQDKYIPTLTVKYIELRIEISLFSLLAQTYTQSKPVAEVQIWESDKAHDARAIILRNIKIHLTPEEIAAEMFCTVGWLKKIFSKVYGTGMFHFLRRTRMEIARERLLKGESLKAVALDVGMKPQNFPKEFKAYFGYTVTDLKKGRV